MKKQTLKFDCLVTMAIFSKQVASGYLMNTTNCTLTGKFTEDDIDIPQRKSLPTNHSDSLSVNR
jgi:hypothetical protein